MAAPKKEPKQKKLSDNIKKFLDRRDDEERARKIKEREKTRALLELRQGCKETSKAARRMLTMTKSANKAVVAEAINTRDTAVTLAGRHQCDEDDYGYESTIAKGYFDKLMSKFEANPEDPMAKFSKPKSKQKKDLSSTVHRVKEALARGEPDPVISSKLGHSRSSSSSATKGSSSNDFLNEHEKPKQDSVRKKDPGPPKPKPKSFAEIMALAKQNKESGKSLGQDPIPPSKNKIHSKTEKEAEFERPMTAKEKREYIRERESMNRKNEKVSPSIPASSSKRDTKHKHSASQPQERSENSKLGKSESNRNNQDVASKPSSKIPNKKDPSDPPKAKRENTSEKKNVSPSPAPPATTPSKQLGKLSQAQIDKLRAFDRAGPASSKNKTSLHHSARSRLSPPRATQSKRDSRASDPYKSPPRNDRKSKQVEPKTEQKQRDFNSVESRPFPGEKKRDYDSVPTRMFPGERGYGSSGNSAKKFKPSNMMKKPNKMRIESDDEDYDSEMDDFIDDSEANVDIGAEIRSIFGYDRRKFRDEADFDDRSMENNRFSDVMKEEARSARIGRMEDLEDMRREEEEKRRKKAKLKKK